MEVTHSFIRVEAFNGTDSPPHEILTRDANERWLVAASPVTMDQPIQWSKVAKERHIYIPLVPYLMAPDMSAALAYMLQIGMRVSFDVGVPIKRLHLAIGTPINEVYEEAMGNLWQYQVGFGILLK